MTRNRVVYDVVDRAIVDLQSQIKRDLAEDTAARAVEASRHLRAAISVVCDLSRSPDMARVAELLSEAADILQRRMQ